jgi:MFS family permease
LLRTALFLLPGSALWALLPLIASRHLELGSSGYGLLLAALGVGAIGGAAILSKVRARLSPNALVGLSGGIFAAALALVILVHATIVVVIVLIPAGMAWVGVTATVSTLLQLFLPRWVRARGLSVYQMVLFGAQGLGALAWGVIAESVGLTATFLIAAGLMAGAAASIHIWPFVDTSGMGRDIVVRPAPDLDLEPDDDSGPVIVSTSYSISTEDEPGFMRAMARVRESRLRTGATQWGLFRDGEKPGRFEEIFVVASWEEHLRQHRERLTATDLSYEDQAKRLSKTVPQSRHLLPTDLDKK